MKPIIDHRELINALGGNKAVSDELDSREDCPSCTPVKVGQWKIGNRIPVEYWPGIIAVAAERGLTEISSDWLMNTVRPRLNADCQAPAPQSAL